MRFYRPCSMTTMVCFEAQRGPHYHAKETHKSDVDQVGFTSLSLSALCSLVCPVCTHSLTLYSLALLTYPTQGYVGCTSHHRLFPVGRRACVSSTYWIILVCDTIHSFTLFFFVDVCRTVLLRTQTSSSSSHSCGAHVDTHTHMLSHSHASTHSHFALSHTSTLTLSHFHSLSLSLSFTLNSLTCITGALADPLHRFNEITKIE
jgi:hypothetical protein